MRNPQASNARNLTKQIPLGNRLQMYPHSLIESQPDHNETVEAKWEQIQYYESKENPSLNSLASGSSASSSASSSGASSTSSNVKLKSRLQRLKQNSLKKLAGFKLWAKKEPSTEATTKDEAATAAATASEVSHVPNGLSLSKMRAAKSMQNLEQLTRDSFYNLKDISNNLKQKYNSRMELRQQSQMYNELWDDEDDSEAMEDNAENFYHPRSFQHY